MKDQLIKLHEEFVDKGMPPSNINIVFLLKHASRIHHRNIGYVLLDMQTWLREEHNILVYVDPRSHHIFQYHIITHDNEIISSERLNNWDKTLFKGLQEAIKLI